MKKTYIISCVWQMYGQYEIEADSLEDAKRIALEDMPLPENGEYLTDSFELEDDDILKELNAFKK